jgi:hypothetical protein
MLGFTPFAIIGMHNEGKDYGIFFFLLVGVLLFPEFYIKVFLKPINAELEENRIVAKYLCGSDKNISLNEINAYSECYEKTNYGLTKGIILYLKNRKHIDFTEVNIKDITPLLNYLNDNKVSTYGSEKLTPWFLFKYKYD